MDQYLFWTISGLSICILNEMRRKDGKPGVKKRVGLYYVTVLVNRSKLPDDICFIVIFEWKIFFNGDYKIMTNRFLLARFEFQVSMPKCGKNPIDFQVRRGKNESKG